MIARRWRLLLDAPMDGAHNMAVDAAILTAYSEGRCPPTLRLYRWSCPTVSLGRFQPVSQVDTEACSAHGIALVRRPTGGRGVLHDDEVTYSVVAGCDVGVPRGTSLSYRYFAGPLVCAYDSLGVRAEVTERHAGVRGTGACYLHSTQADLSAGLAKLSGSAQVWKGKAVLQHGSFVIRRDADLEGRLFRLPEEQVAVLRERTVTLDGLLDRSPSVDEITRAVVSAFEHSLGVVFDPGPLFTDELAVAERLTTEYAVGVTL